MVDKFRIMDTETQESYNKLIEFLVNVIMVSVPDLENALEYLLDDKGTQMWNEAIRIHLEQGDE